MLHALIMAGGSGTRFWPLSRAKEPKQFLRVFGPRSLIQQSFDRIAGLVKPDKIMVITNAAQASLTKEHLPDLKPNMLIAEPQGRDTAAAIGLGAALIARKDPQATMVVLAADHLIPQVDAFRLAIAAAAAFVEKNPETLLTFGITPNRPATGYGYLHRGEEWDLKDVPIYKIRSFREKPNAETAAEYIESGEYFWNSGIFVWRAATILKQLANFAPMVYEAALKTAAVWDTPERDATFAAEYQALSKISIDYAVMEKAESVAMVEAPFGWDDVGSWSALPRVFEPDSDGNVILGPHVGRETHDCVVVTSSEHLVATLGVRNVIVVRTPDVTLVADADREQEVKQVLDTLREKGLEKLL